MKKWLLALLVMLVVGITALLLANLPQPPAGPVSAQLLKAGPFEVATLELDLKDTRRTTSANGDYPELPWRALPATVWYPVGGSHHPLIVSSHGFSSMRLGATYLAQSLAALGYVVVAADFPLTNFFARGGPNIADVVNQPGDISFLIDRMLAFSDDPTHPLHDRIDATRIGATGISLGGMTSTMAGFDPKRMDTRIKAVASVAGPSMVFGAKWFAHRQLPFLMVATPTDAIVNYEDNARPILHNVAGAILVTIANASHTGFAQPARYMRWMTNPDLIGCAVVMHNLNKPGWGSQSWYHLIGSSEDGIIDGGKLRICEADPLPQTMNPVYQHWLTQLAVTSFFEAQFNTDAGIRQQHLDYLTSVMAAEIADVHVEQEKTIAAATADTTQMADVSAPPAP
jgi:predicted dienelactone hydrolase